MIHKLYLYKRPVELLYLGEGMGCCTLDNRPMNKRLIKLHKGVDNTIPFKVFTQDKKCADVRQMWISATLVTSHQPNREKIFEKPCTVSSKGDMFELVVQESDLTEVSPGTYKMIITSGEELSGTAGVGEIIAKPFYTDMDENISLDVEVVESADTTPTPSVEISWDQWTPTGMDDVEQSLSQSAPFNLYNTGYTKYYTGAIAGNRVKNRNNAVHSFSIQGKNLSGRVRVLGTLDDIAQPNPNDYFQLNVTSVEDEIIFDEFTGTEGWTFQGNFTFLKFEFLPDYSKGDDWGEIVNLIVRT